MRKLLTLIVLLSTISTSTLANRNLERSQALQKCDHELYQKTNSALTFSMVMDYCEREKAIDLLAAADLWKKIGTVGFADALARVKALPQD
ncbi:MAG: hypothetical protein SGJ18_13665 [Pseudomonadota bacterium]|nr:hypothetical protein [Pseudomonadota bacterium]